MILRINFKKLLLSIAIPLLAGGLSALISGGTEIYTEIKRPPLSPPGIVFPIVWTILYILMGISLYLISISDKKADKSTAYLLFGIQLFLNFIWSPIFFGAQQFLVAFIVLILLWIFTLLMIIVFYNISKPAGLLQIPYLIWLTFAAYLNLSIYLLNK